MPRSPQERRQVRRQPRLLRLFVRGPQLVRRQVLPQVLLRVLVPVRLRVLLLFLLRVPESVQRQALPQVLLRVLVPVRLWVPPQVPLKVSESILLRGRSRFRGGAGSAAGAGACSAGAGAAAGSDGAAATGVSAGLGASAFFSSSPHAASVSDRTVRRQIRRVARESSSSLRCLLPLRARRCPALAFLFSII